jgi:hypothetical protein
MSSRVGLPLYNRLDHISELGAVRHIKWNGVRNEALGDAAIQSCMTAPSAER